EAWSTWRAAREAAVSLRERAERSAAEAEELSLRLAELDRLDPRPGEETELAESRAPLGAADEALARIRAARAAPPGDPAAGRLPQALRALGRARERAVAAGAGDGSPAVRRIAEAAEAAERALVEATEAAAAVDAAAAAFDFEPDRLEKAEE